MNSLSQKLIAYAQYLQSTDNHILVSAEENTSCEIEKTAQTVSIQPYIDALTKAMREYTATEWTPEMKEWSDRLMTWGPDEHPMGVNDDPSEITLAKVARMVAQQPWGKDPAVNKAATDLWQACQNANKQVHASQVRSPLTIVAEALVAASDMLVAAAEEVAALEPDVITTDALDELAIVAEAFDNSDDELLRKQASVLDAVLELFAKKDVKAAKDAEAKKIDQLKLKYQDPKKINDERGHIAEAVKDIEKAPMYKEYRPLQTELSMRVCPDHFCQIARIGEDRFQCVLDKRIYDYREGFTLLNGNKVPPSSISEQTQHLWSNIGSPVFDTRSDRTGQDNG